MLKLMINRFGRKKMWRKMQDAPKTTPERLQDDPGIMVARRIFYLSHAHLSCLTSIEHFTCLANIAMASVQACDISWVIVSESLDPIRRGASFVRAVSPITVDRHNLYARSCGLGPVDSAVIEVAMTAQSQTNILLLSDEYLLSVSQMF